MAFKFKLERLLQKSQHRQRVFRAQQETCSEESFLFLKALRIYSGSYLSWSQTAEQNIQLLTFSRAVCPEFGDPVLPYWPVFSRTSQAGTKSLGL